MQVNFTLASSLKRGIGRKGEGEKAGKNSPFQAKSFASNSETPSYRATVESNSCEPHSPLLSMRTEKAQAQFAAGKSAAFPLGARKAQAAFEYYLLLLLASVLAITALAWASGFSTSEKAVQSNASAALGNFTNRSLSAQMTDFNDTEVPGFALEIVSFEPYLAGQPAFFQVNAFAAGKASLPALTLRAKTPAGDNVQVSPSSFASSGFSFSRTLSSEFYPNSTGAYTITATCGNLTAARDVLVR